MTTGEGSIGEDVYKRLQTQLRELWGRRDITQPISFRMPLYIKMIYDSLDAESKRRVKLALEQLILALAGLKQEPSPGQPIIVNMNININEAKNNVNINLKPIKEILERLYKLREPLPPLQKKLVEDLYSRFTKLN